jgi:hypothetical protein
MEIRAADYNCPNSALHFALLCSNQACRQLAKIGSLAQSEKKKVCNGAAMMKVRVLRGRKSLATENKLPGFKDSFPITKFFVQQQYIFDQCLTKNN